MIAGTATASDRSLSEETVLAVLAVTVDTRRSLRRLVSCLEAQPDVFAAGPTSVVPILDRFTKGLVAAGAETIRSIDPVCDTCRRRRPRHARTDKGGLCSACSARTNKHACSVCDRVRHIVWQDPDRRAVCAGCLGRRRRIGHLDSMAEQIAVIVCATDSSITRQHVTAVINRVASTVPDRTVLRQEIHAGPSLAIPARRGPVVARLVAQLRAGGAGLPAGLCDDCGQPAEPFVVHHGVVRCRPCQRRRDREYRGGSDTAAYQLIAEAVTAADPTVTEELLRRVLEATVSSRRSLLGLAAHIAAHPDVFSVGPTSVTVVLDRFTRALVEAGARTIRTIDPVCAGCGRRRRRQARSPTGGLCSACAARNRNSLCTLCGHTRRVERRDGSGGAICAGCVRRRGRLRRLDDTAEQIIAVFERTGSPCAAQIVVAAIERTTPNLNARALLVEQLTSGPSPATSAHRHPIVARLLADLRAAGVAIPAATCNDCDGPADPLVIHRSVVRCKHCATHCPICRHPRSRPAAERCRWCLIGPGRPTCTECGRAARGLQHGDRCRQCHQRADRHCLHCGRTTKLTRAPDGWTCHPCALNIELDDHLGPASGLPGPLRALRAAMARADNPAGVRRWLRTTSGGRFLRRFATGQEPLTHEALDDAGDDRSISHLRALLVATDTLAADDRSLDRLERFFERYLDSRVADPTDRKIVRAWLRWHVLPRLRKRAASGASMDHSTNNARRALHFVTEFLNQLHRRRRNLRTVTQTDIDHWFAEPSATPWLARQFLVWARQRQHLPARVRLPATPPKVVRPALDDPTRWAIARRLVTDDTLTVDDRVAAALVVIYAQPVTRVARLATTDIHPGPDGTAIVNLDGNQVPIHQPFAGLINQLPHRRTHGVTDQIGSGWLFPGGHAGRHVSPVILANRLRAIGIEPRNMRNTARGQLATEIPPALLGKLIGVSPATATRWATLTNANWAAYAADRAH